MLSQLTIENYALIEKLEVNFHSGFSVITGETGAGKSILLGALAMVLGSRADTRVLLDKERKCIIEASFDTTGYQLDDFFISHDLDDDKVTLLRREISPQGKSRSFINDTPVNLNVLKELGGKLVDIFSQHGLLQLKDPIFQLAVIDNYAGLKSEVNEFGKAFEHYRGLRQKLKDLKSREMEMAKEQDYLKFLLDELESLDLKQGEKEQLEANQQIWEHAEEIKTTLYQGFNELSGEEGNILARLNVISRGLEKLSAYHSAINPLYERFQSSMIELEDISRELEKLYNETDFDPSQLEGLNERLDRIYRLEQKHQVQKSDDLLVVRDSIRDRVAGFSSLTEEIQSLEKAIEEKHAELMAMAGRLSDERTDNIPVTEKEISLLLTKMGMSEGKVVIKHKKREELSATGLDEVEFLFTANPGVEPQPLSRIASGGELSRLMLSVKSLISEKNLLPTIIFDEIDNGISGDISGKVGEVMHDLSSKMQVIAITHLPQIAGKGHHHYRVYKDIKAGKTKSLMEPVEGEARVEEITKMLAGDEKTTATRKAAREFLEK